MTGKIRTTKRNFSVNGNKNSGTNCTDMYARQYDDICLISFLILSIKCITFRVGLEKEVNLFKSIIGIVEKNEKVIFMSKLYPK